MSARLFKPGIDQVAVTPQRRYSRAFFFKLTVNPVGIFTLRATTIQRHATVVDRIRFQDHGMGAEMSGN